MTRDWDFKSENAVCELRAAGILIHDGKVLFDHVMATMNTGCLAVMCR